MFLENKYKRWYFIICEKSTHREYHDNTEKHHIIPKSLGGRNTKSNIVRLTPREHYVAHLCLVRCTEGIAKQKMLLAVRFFGLIHKGMKVNSRLFESLRLQAKQVIADRVRARCATPEYREVLRRAAKKYKHPKVSAEGKKNMQQAARRRAGNSIYCAKLSASAKQRWQDPAYIEKQRISHLGKKRKTTWTLSEDTKNKIRVAKLAYWAKRRCVVS